MIQNTRDAKQIFLEAIENHAPEEWPDFLVNACAGNESLRQRVASLLAAHTASADIIDSSERRDPPLVGEQVGDWIGPYRIASQIGEGAYGNVYLVEQLAPLRRRLAMKILKPGVDTRQVIRRFEAERETLAQLEHPNISRIVDAGATSVGRPYFVMEHVDGCSLTEYCRQSQPNMRERLRLFVEVCRAVEHAHQRGIIHRDLKPSNIMVALVDGIATVKVIDFGVSKALSPGENLTASRSMLPNLLGTPNYMSPEQFSIGQTEVDARSDVYSLGIILYELLIGRPLHNDQELRRLNLLELARVVRDEVVPAPSRYLQKCYAHVSGNQKLVEVGMTLHELRAELRPELDWIVSKAIEKQPERRYQSAELLAADVQAYLLGKMVAARPASAWYAANKFLQRHRLWVASSAMIATILLSAWLLIAWERHRANVVLTTKAQSDAAQQMEQQELLLQQYPNDIHRAWSLTRHGLSSVAEQLLDRYVPMDGAVDRRDFAWHYLRQCLSADIRHFDGLPGPLLTSDISPDNQWIAAGDRLGNVCVWRASSGEIFKQWHYADKEVTTVRFSPDGRILASAGQDSHVHLWDTQAWNEQLTFGPHGGTITSLSWEPNGQRIATGGRDKRIVIWDAQTGNISKALEGLEDVVRAVEWSSDGKMLAAAEGPSVHLWQTSNWHTLKHFHNQTEAIHGISFSPDNSQLIAIGHAAHLCFYDVQQLVETADVATAAHLWSAAWSSDGDHLAIGTTQGGPHMWRYRASNSYEVLNITQPPGRQRTSKFTNDGNWLLAAYEQDSHIILWNLPKLLGFSKIKLDGYHRASQLTTSLVIVQDGPNRNTLHWLNNEQSPWTLDMEAGPADIDSTGEILATSSGKRLALWHAPSRKQLWSEELDLNDICRVLFSHSGNFLAVSNANDVLLLEAKSGKTLTKIQSNSLSIPAFEFSPDDRFLCTTTDEGVICCPTNSPTSIRSYADDRRNYRCVAFSPAGDSLYLSDVYGIVKLDLATAKFDTEHSGLLTHAIRQMVMSPDAKTLAVATEVGSLHLFDPATGIELLTLLEHAPNIRDLQFETATQLKFCTDDSEGNSTVIVFDVDSSSR